MSHDFVEMWKPQYLMRFPRFRVRSKTRKARKIQKYCEGTSLVGGIACVYVCIFVHVMRNGILVYMYYILGGFYGPKSRWS